MGDFDNGYNKCKEDVEKWFKEADMIGIWYLLEDNLM